MRLGQVDRVRERVRDWQSRLLGVDVDRRHVQLEVRRGCHEVEAHDAPDREPQAGLEVQRNPRCVFPELQRVDLARHRELRGRPIGPDLDLEGHAHLTAGPTQRVLRTRNRAPDHSTIRIELDRDPFAAREWQVLMRLAAEIGIRPLAPLEIRDAHRREHDPVESLGREGDRHTENGAEDAVVSQNLPKGLALTTALNDRPAERDAEAPEGEHPFRRADLRRREFREMRLSIRDQKVIDPMFPRVTACLKRRPRHGRFRQQRRLEGKEGALLAQARKNSGAPLPS